MFCSIASLMFYTKNTSIQFMSHNDVMARPARILIWKSPGPETRLPIGVAL